MSPEIFDVTYLMVTFTLAHPERGPWSLWWAHGHMGTIDPASAASPRAILLPEAPGTCLTKNGKNRRMEMNAGKF